MRAVVYSELGDSSVLEVVDREVPTPHWGQVRVRLEVAGVNPTDWKARAGATAPARAGVFQDAARAAFERSRRALDRSDTQVLRAAMREAWAGSGIRS